MRQDIRRAVRAATLVAALMSTTAQATPSSTGMQTQDAIEGRFRGCDDTRVCRFEIDSGAPAAPDLYRVIPEGVSWSAADALTARAVRDRLNALMSSMIHQHKRVELFALRMREDGTYTARITVNGADVARDPTLIELVGERPAAGR